VRSLANRLALSLLGLALVGGCGTRDDPILIGLAGPFSQPRGASMQLGAELAIAEINAEGGVRGRPLALLVRDDSAVTDVAVHIARELYDRPGLVAVIGHLNSSTTIAAAPIYNGGRNPVAQISPSASSPLVTEAGPYTFRVCPSDLVHGERLADWAWDQLQARTASVIYQNDDYGRGVRSAFSDAFQAMGGRILTEDPYVASLPTFEPYLRRLLQRGGVEAIMIAGTREGAERIIATADSLGLAYPIMGADGLTGLEASGTDASGTYVSSAYLPGQAGTANERFVAAYRDTYGDRLPDHRGAGAYDIVYMLADAIAAVGPDREHIQLYLSGVGSDNPAFNGVTGTITFDAYGDVPDKDVVIGIVRDDRIVPAQQ
jgi:branched-chain amino acid transport system substrate-binding protein